MLETTPRHVNGECGFLSFDAEVTVPALPPYQEYHAEIPSWDRPALADLFFESDAPSPKSAIEPGTDLEWTYFESEQDSLAIGGGTLIYGSSSESAPLYEVALQRSRWSGLLDETFPSKDLSFMSADDAEFLAMAFLEKLGLETYGRATVRSLDHATLNAELAARDGDRIETPFQFSGESFMPSDDVYLIEARIALDGTPVSDIDYSDSLTGNYYPGSSVEVWVGCEGIIKVAIQRSIVHGRASSNVPLAKMVTLESAIESVARKFEGLIGVEGQHISKIELAYVRRPREDASELAPVFVPAWVLEMPASYGGRREAFRVDACTGEVL